MKPISPFVRNLFIFLTVLAISGHTAFMLSLIVNQAQLKMELAKVHAELAMTKSELARVKSEKKITVFELRGSAIGLLKKDEICIPGSGYRKPISLMDIVYVEAFNGQTIFYLTNGKQLSCEYGLDKAQRELLKNKDFCRINRTYVVNRPHYKYYTPREAKRAGFSDFGKWGIVVNNQYGQLKLSQSGRDRCYGNGKDIEYCF